MTNPRRARRPATTRLLVGWVAVPVLAVPVLAGCSHDDGSVATAPASTTPSGASRTTTQTTPPRTPATTDGSPAPTPSTAPAPLRVSVARVKGHLAPAGQRRLAGQVRRVVGSWLDAGFVAGSYPRTAFPDAYARFTPQAAKLAQQQAAVTSNAVLGPELVDVTATHRSVRVYAFSPAGRPAGATAVVTLVLLGTRSDGSHLELTVTGDLDLTPGRSGWQVFGFDLQRSVGAPGTYAKGQRHARQRPGASTGGH